MQTKKNIAVMGANGFVGRAVCSAINKTNNFNLIRIVRSDDLQHLLKEADLIVHCANSSKRYYANTHAQQDFIDTVEKMANICSLSGEKKIILISTISARIQLDTPYGRHRRTCELMLNLSKDLIIRLGPMFGEKNPKGALFDIIKNQNTYVDEQTRYAYVDINYNAQKIVDLLDEIGLLELGAKNSIKLRDLKKAIGSTSEFKGHDDTQILNTTQEDAPDAFDVIPFARNIKKCLE